MSAALAVALGVLAGAAAEAPLKVAAGASRQARSEVSCDFRVQDHTRSVYYAGLDVSSAVARAAGPWRGLQRVSVRAHPGAYLVIYGEDVEGDSFGSGGFWASCAGVPVADRFRKQWESYCADDALDNVHRRGEGTGWTPAIFHSSSHDGAEWSLGSLGAPGMRHCAFRMVPVEEGDAGNETGAIPQPPDLPEGWVAIWDTDHEAYFFWKKNGDVTTWSITEVQRMASKDAEREAARLKEEAKIWDRPCRSREDCLKIVDAFMRNQPRQPNLLMRTYGESLGGGDCGANCQLEQLCPTDPLIPGCRYDVYDNAVAAIYLTKRGLLERAEVILTTFLELLYPRSLVGINPYVMHAVPSGRVLTLLAAAYTDRARATPGVYDGEAVYDGGVDTGNNAWVALAFAHYAAETHSACHAEVARDILAAITKNECADSLGGVVGRMQPYPRYYRSTEHNIDVAALARALGDKETWEQTHRFVHGMYGRNVLYNHSYSMGTGDEGMCDSSQPTGPVAADCTFWNILADADPNRDRMEKALAFALASPTKAAIRAAKDPDKEAQQGLWTSDEDKIHYTGKTLHGARFSTWGSGVQWEVTSAAAMAVMHFADKYGDDLEDQHGSKVDLWEHVKQARDSIKLLLGMYKGVPGSVVGGNRDAWVQWTIHPDRWKRDVTYTGGSDTAVGWSYLRYPHVASTAWAGLMLLYQGEDGGKTNPAANPLFIEPSRIPKPPALGSGACSKLLGTGDGALTPAAPESGATSGTSTTLTVRPTTTVATTFGATSTTPTTTSGATSSTTSATEAVQTDAATVAEPDDRTQTETATTSSTPTATTSTSTATSSTTSTSTATTTLLPIVEFALWRDWQLRGAYNNTPPFPQIRSVRRASVDSTSPAPTQQAVREIRQGVKFPGSWPLGVKFDQPTVAVTGFDNDVAAEYGWRIGDRVVSVEEMPVATFQELKSFTDVAWLKVPAVFKVLRVDVCQHTCAEVLHELGATCDETFADVCGSAQPPIPFLKTSKMVHLCPVECGGPKLLGGWTHTNRPGEEVILVDEAGIHWSTGGVSAITQGTEGNFSTVWQGNTYTGQLLDDGTVKWSDGDSWVRMGGVVAEGMPPLSQTHVVTATGSDGDLGFVCADWPPARTRVSWVDPSPKSWARRVGLPAGAELISINGQLISDMDKLAYQALVERQRPLKLVYVEGRTYTEGDWREWKLQHVEAPEANPNDPERLAWEQWKEAHKVDAQYVAYAEQYIRAQRRPTPVPVRKELAADSTSARRPRSAASADAQTKFLTPPDGAGAGASAGTRGASLAWTAAPWPWLAASAITILSLVLFLQWYRGPRHDRRRVIVQTDLDYEDALVRVE